jgi:hypothetical protein
MFKYTPKKQIVRQLDKNKTKLSANWDYAGKVLGMINEKVADYTTRNAFIVHYSKVEFYSTKSIMFIPVNGILLPTSIFDETVVEKLG